MTSRSGETSAPYQRSSGVYTSTPGSGASYGGRYGLMSRTGEPSITSAPKIRTVRFFASTASIRTSESPTGLGRCGVRVDSTPTLTLEPPCPRPWPRGGRILAGKVSPREFRDASVLAPLVLAWKRKMTHAWLCSASPSIMSGETPEQRTTDARASGTNPGCRGVPCTSS